MDDIAVSSFAAIRGTRPRAPPTSTSIMDSPFLPRDSSARNNRMGSLDAVAGGVSHTPRRDSNEVEDDLFAVKLSPRSPEMTKSPFSFTTKDTAPWLKDHA